MTAPNLISLGWDSFFERQVSPEDLASCCPARIIAVHRDAFVLADELQGSIRAVAAGKMLRDCDLPVVGDWVLVRGSDDGTALIVRRLDRRSALFRRRPLDRASVKTSRERQVLAANLDYVFAVMSLNQDLNLSRLERALTLIWNSGATPVVLLSKADLCPGLEEAAAEVEATACGARVYTISTLQKYGLDVISDLLASGLTGCLIGSSGAGKTTLINALCGTHNKTLEVREADDKGRHATTVRELFFLSCGGMLIDTPGVRELGLMEDCDLEASFSDIGRLAKDCRFSDCTHRVEPGCAVLASVASGALAPERYDSHLKLSRELEHEASKHEISGHLDAKRKGKQLSKLIKNYYKERR